MTDFTAPAITQLLEEERQARLDRIARAWNHYDGDVAAPLPLSEEGIDDNIQVFRADTVVDKGASFLFRGPGGVQLQTDDDRAVGLIGAAWPEAQRAVQLHNMAVNGGVTGQVFVRLRLDGRLIVLDPSNVEVEWAEDDFETVTRWLITWTTVDATTGKPVVKRQRIQPDGQQWEIVDERAVDGGEFRVTGTETWPYEWPPIMGCQNLPKPNEFWGKPDLTGPVLDLIEVTWALTGYMRKLVRFNGHPLPYVTGATADDMAKINVAVGQLLAVGKPEAKIGQLTAPGDLGAVIQLYRELKDEFREITCLPEIVAGKVENIGQLSGFALQILYGPLLERTEVKHNMYGPLVCEIASRLLEIRQGLAEVEITPVWGNPLPHDEAAETTALEADQRMGIVSQQTLAEKRGYDWETEQTRLEVEGEASREVEAQTFNAL